MRVAYRESIRQAALRLSELLGVHIDAVNINYEPRFGGQRVDAIVESGSHQFAIEWKAASSLGHVFRAVHQVREMASALPNSMIPLLGRSLYGGIS